MITRRELLGSAAIALTQPATGAVTMDAQIKAPAMRWRGMHILMGGRDSIPAVERLVTEHLPALKLNQLIVEVNYGFQYRSHPEVADPGGLGVEDCRRLSDLCRKRETRLIPMLNCLGHQSWAGTTFKLLTSHPEFDETPDYPADNKGIYCRSWCPSHPELPGVVNSLIDELIDAFRADAFHVGMDEVFILGKCPRCKGKDNSELFAKSVNDLHRHIVGKRKRQMMIWGDRLLDAKSTGNSEWEASANGTAPAIDRVPKDIVVCDWHYGVRDDYPSVKYFLDRGFPVWPAGWNSAGNARKLAACALRNRHDRMLGYMATTWLPIGSVVSALEGDEKALGGSKDMPGLVAGIREGARIAYSGQ
jgi:hypothetical protein